MVSPVELLQQKEVLDRQIRQDIQSPPNPRWTLPPRSVKILKKWLFGHRLYAYPTTTEKVALSKKTNLTVLQIGNWFSNARRRTLPEMLRREGKNPLHFTKSHCGRKRKSSLKTTDASPKPITRSRTSEVVVGSSEEIEDQAVHDGVAPGHYFVQTTGGQVIKVEPDVHYDDGVIYRSEHNMIVYDPCEAQREGEVKCDNADAWQSVIKSEDATATTSSASNATCRTSTVITWNVANNTNSNHHNSQITNNNNTNNLMNSNTATSTVQVNPPGTNLVKGVIRDDREDFEILYLLVDTAAVVRQREKNRKRRRTEMCLPVKL